MTTSDLIEKYLEEKKLNPANRSLLRRFQKWVEAQERKPIRRPGSYVDTRGRPGGMAGLGGPAFGGG